MKTLTVTTRAAWRRWLRAQHAKTAEIWLVYYKKHTGRKSIPYGDSVEEALCYGWIDSLLRRIDDDRYARKFTPRRPGSNWSKLNRQRVAKLTKAGKMTKVGLALVEAAKKDGTWTRPTVADTEFAMPEELTSRLARNKKARAAFEGLPPSHQKQYIAWIASAKRPETRQRRADEAVRLLSKGEALGMK